MHGRFRRKPAATRRAAGSPACSAASPSRVWITLTRRRRPGPAPCRRCGCLSAGIARYKPRVISVARMRNFVHRHCERSEAIHLSPRRGVDCFAALAMTVIDRSKPDVRIREHDHLDRKNVVTSLADQERVARHPSPHCCRNSNLPAPMRGRASVQLLPACETYG